MQKFFAGSVLLFGLILTVHQPGRCELFTRQTVPPPKAKDHPFNAHGKMVVDTAPTSASAHVRGPRAVKMLAECTSAPIILENGADGVRYYIGMRPDEYVPPAR